MEEGCILKIEHPLSSIDGACKVGKMIIVEKVSIYDNDLGYNSKTEGYTTFMSDINKLSAIPHTRQKKEWRFKLWMR